MSDYEPSPELVEAMHSRGFYRADVYDHLRAAVAFRHPDDHPELVPWEQVRELVEAALGLPMFPVGAHDRWRANGNTEDANTLDAHDAAWRRLRFALAPFTQEPEA